MFKFLEPSSYDFFYIGNSPRRGIISPNTIRRSAPRQAPKSPLFLIYRADFFVAKATAKILLISALYLVATKSAALRAKNHSRFFATKHLPKFQNRYTDAIEATVFATDGTPVAGKRKGFLGAVGYGLGIKPIAEINWASVMD